MVHFYLTVTIFDSRKKEIAIYELTFFNRLMEKLSWKNDMLYKVYGDFISEHNILGFNMDNPIIMERIKK